MDEDKDLVHQSAHCLGVAVTDIQDYIAILEERIITGNGSMDGVRYWALGENTRQICESLPMSQSKMT